MRKSTPFLPYLGLACAVVLWGLSFVVTKVALNGLPPMAILFLRFAVASVFFLGLYARRGWPRLDRSDHLRVALIALFMPVAYFILEAYGIKLTTASKASLLTATIPIVVLVASSVVDRRRPKPKVLAGVALSLPGVGLLVAGGGDAQELLAGPQIGDLSMAGAVAAASAYIILTGRLGTRVSTSTLTGMQMIYGAVVLAPFFAASARHIVWREAALPLAATFALGLGPTIAGFLAYNYALSAIPPSRASLGINLIPVVTAGGAWVLLGEHLAPLQMAGGVIVLGAVLLATAPSGNRVRRRVADSDPEHPSN